MESNNTGCEIASGSGLNPNASIFVSKFSAHSQTTFEKYTNDKMSCPKVDINISKKKNKIKNTNLKNGMKGNGVPEKFSQMISGSSHQKNSERSASFDWRKKELDTKIYISNNNKAIEKNLLNINPHNNNMDQVVPPNHKNKENLHYNKGEFTNSHNDGLNKTRKTYSKQNNYFGTYRTNNQQHFNLKSKHEKRKGLEKERSQINDNEVSQNFKMSSNSNQMKPENKNIIEDKRKIRLKKNASKLEKIKNKYLKPQKEFTVNSTENQREKLEEELQEGSYECMVCCGVVRGREEVWSCACCSHIFHLKCIQKWASSPNSQILSTQSSSNQTADNRLLPIGSSTDRREISGTTISNTRSNSTRGNNGSGDFVIDFWRDSGINGDFGLVLWRCPTCQQITKGFPKDYFCFCGKHKNPAFNGYQVPHSCGEVCKGKRGGVESSCIHPCTILCHPGPCPPCSVFTNVKCLCGGQSVNLKCSSNRNIRCEAGCSKELNCGKHVCSKICHALPCQPCDQEVELTCHCGKKNKQVLCGSKQSFMLSYNCENTCNKVLDCNNHHCNSPCHPGPCPSCPLLPINMQHCPCGKERLEKLGGGERKGCLDAVMCCSGICDKELLCGNEGKRHRCVRKCHEGGCGGCGGMTKLPCRCGATIKEVECDMVVIMAESSIGGNETLIGDGVAPDGQVVDLKREGVKCDNRCYKKFSCGRHKCLNHCCNSQNHQCKLICGYKLSCGQHKCQETCHRGKCQQCWNISWEELRCHCGAEVLYPPIQCSTPPPSCLRNCIRVRPCGHQTLHPCHHEDTCPPCTILVDRVCLCGKEVRRNVPCYLSEVTCGLACSKTLACQMHHCLKICHKDACSIDSSCTQPCSLPRPSCSHPCNHPCHPGKPCPPGVCHYEIVGACGCGRKKHGRMLCLKEEKCEREAVYGGLKDGEGMSKPTPNMTHQTIACDSECEKMKRNRRLAEALGIDQQQHNLLPPNYPQSVIDYYKKHTKLCREIELVLTDLVNSVHQNATYNSGGSRKYHYFKPMSQSHRAFIHEVAPSYGVESESHDFGSQRSVVATASKFTSKLPLISIEKFIKDSPK